MTCILRQPIYSNPKLRGVREASSMSDGNNEEITWYRAYPDSLGFNIAYNIYFSTLREDVFAEGPKFVSISPTVLFADISNFTAGDVFYFAVRATEFEPGFVDLSLLPDGYDDGYLRVYPSGILLSNISDSDLNIPVSDVDIFPPMGIVQIGDELIRYNSIDLIDGYLVVAERGFYDTDITFHNTDGYDGDEFGSALVTFWPGFEDDNTVVAQSESKFSYPHQIYNNDGYREIDADLLTTDLTASDAAQIGFKRYDYSGYHRTSPEQILLGNCIGSYIGGTFYCADGYLGVGRQVRGIPIVDQNNQRQETLLSVTGEPCVLMRRMWKGKVCRCVDSSREIAEPRCPYCFGVGFVSGYEQFHNPRRSDGRIMVRFGPAVDDLVADEAGLESKMIPDNWTIVVPAVKDRDFLVRYNTDSGLPEFRYEILNVTRQRFFVNEEAAQKFTSQRVRKFDPIYQVPVFADSSTMPSSLSTSVGFMAGPNKIQIPHVHTVVVSENITSITQINQMTSIDQNHSHVVRNGVVLPALGHSHTLIL